jgi:DNA-binding winged helix-turn-helix (wHTH) protein
MTLTCKDASLLVGYQNLMGDSSQLSYKFGPYCLDTRRRVLMRGGALVPLPPKAFDILLILVQNSGQEMSKQELMERIWPDSFVEESNLAQNIFLLRRALREEKKEHQYIVTAPGRGYRFVARVEEFGEASPVDREPFRTTGIINYHRATSLAVLLFKPLTAGEKDALLSVGLADAIIMQLSNLMELSVRPTTSVLKYDDQRQDPLAAGRELNVDLVLDGIYQRDGDQLRVTTQLVRIEDGATLWAMKFDESFTNIFAVQDSISEQVGRLLTLKLCSEELRQLRKGHTDNTEAFSSTPVSSPIPL